MLDGNFLIVNTINLIKFGQFLIVMKLKLIQNKLLKQQLLNNLFLLLFKPIKCLSNSIKVVYSQMLNVVLNLIMES